MQLVAKHLARRRARLVDEEGFPAGLSDTRRKLSDYVYINWVLVLIISAVFVNTLKDHLWNIYGLLVDVILGPEIADD